MGRAYDWRSAEGHWQEEWRRAHVFEADADPARPKWFGTVPYPYCNAYLHIGFGTTFLHVDATARYKRMRGFNVLFPQAFHVTGLPILGAAKRVAEGEARQIEILRSMGFPESEVPKFADPRHWIDVFVPAARKDIEGFGAGVDWRRTFITTHLNPHYDAFVKWQFLRLREGGYVALGKHPVIWCPRDQVPIGDHDRYRGEGETPQEFTLLKFPQDGRFLVAATLRPETVYGQTNLWVDPEAEYVEARVDGEVWVVNSPAATKLGEQGHRVTVERHLRGLDLLGVEAVAPAIHRAIPVLPGHFIDQSRGTGIVTSVPSDAPDDYVALRDLQGDPEAIARAGLSQDRVAAIQAIPIIRIEGWGPLPAKDAVERLGIRTQREGDKLAQAKAEVYAAGFYRGVMNETCGPYAGVKVEEAKERIKEDLLASGEAAVLWEPTGEVVCRCLTPAIVKVVDDQWFLVYGDRAWKEKTHRGLSGMKVYPEVVRRQLEYVIDWLRNWACAHHQGLGTTLPWDDRWVIESLSDSTIYMAYYTIAHRLKDLDPATLTPDLFDYVFLGRGEAAGIAKAAGLAAEVLEALRDEFLYWYPFDLRNTGKDLVQNHMAFCLFNHVAIFPSEHWPRAFGVNGFVDVSGEKMSKSRGNAILIREAVEKWGADATRLTLLQGGEGMDDPNFDLAFAKSANPKLARWHRYATARHRIRRKRRAVDAWFEAVMAQAIGGASEAMEALLHRTALKAGYFDLQREWAWYLKRCGGSPLGTILDRFVRIQTKLLAPFTPHVAEDIWHALGEPGSIQTAPWPTVEAGAVDLDALASEALVKSTLEDIRNILRVTGLKPTAILLYVAPAWKARMYARALELRGTGKVDMGVLIREAREDPALAERGKEVADYARRAMEAVQRLGGEALATYGRVVDEDSYLNDAKRFLAKEVGAPVTVRRADDASAGDAGKAQQAVPWRPAIHVIG